MKQEELKHKDDESVGNDEACKKPASLDVDSLSVEELKSVLKATLAESEKTVSELSELDKIIEKLKGESADFKDKWYRSVAEFENYKKRNSEVRRNAYFDGKKDTILNILVIGDSIERALSTDLDEKTREGVNLIARQFKDSLESMGVETINPVGEVFNPDTSEAIHTVEAEEGEGLNVVKTVFKKGYKLDDKIIRYCQVVVTK